MEEAAVAVEEAPEEGAAAPVVEAAFLEQAALETLYRPR